MIKLLFGDCLEKMDELIQEGIKFDAIITDPPYGTTACKWDQVIPFDDMWNRLKQLRKDKTPIVLFGSEPFSSLLRVSNLKEYKYDWVWDKQRGGSFFNAKLKPFQIIENILIFSNGKTSNGNKNNMYYYPQMEEAKKENIRPKNKESKIGEAIYDNRKNKRKAKSSDNYNPNKRYPKNLISISGCINECNSIYRVHPTQKPVALLEYLIKTYTNEGDLVLDFTIGSGTTGRACKNLNRSFIGIENDKKYFEIAKDRIENNKVFKKNNKVNMKIEKNNNLGWI